MLRDETGDLYEAHQATPFMDRLAQPEDRSNQQLRRFEREGWTLSRGRGMNGSKLYFVPDIGASVGLAAVQATGVADREIMKVAADALYRWQPEQEEQDHYPVTGALYGIMNNQMWVLDVRILRNEAGKKIVRAFCYDADDRPPNSGNSISNIMVNLSYLLVPLSVQLCRAMMGAESQN
jgi:hypothetical protein